MDEPCSALDPIATARIEELIDELRAELHASSSSPTRCSRRRASRSGPPSSISASWSSTATTDQIFTNPQRQADPGLHHRPVRLSAAQRGRHDMSPNTSSRPIDERARRAHRHAVAEMGGLAEQQLADADRRAAPSATPSSADRVIAGRRADRRARERRSRRRSIRLLALRQPMARRPARDHGRRSRSPPTSSASAISPRTSPSARRADPDAPAAQAADRRHAHGQAGAAAAQGRARRLRRARRRQGARGVARDEEIDALLQLAVPRAADLHDGGSAQHHACARICCSSPRTSSGSAITPPTSPRTSTTSCTAGPLAEDRPKRTMTSRTLLELEATIDS